MGDRYFLRNKDHNKNPEKPATRRSRPDTFERQYREQQTKERQSEAREPESLSEKVDSTAQDNDQRESHEQRELRSAFRKQSQQESPKHVRWVDEQLGQDLATFQTASKETKRKRKESDEGNTQESKRLETQRLERAKLAEDRAKQIELRTRRAKDRAEKKEALSNEDSPLFVYPESLDLDEEITDIATTRRDPKQASSATPIEGSSSHSSTELLDLDEIGGK